MKLSLEINYKTNNLHFAKEKDRKTKYLVVATAAFDKMYSKKTNSEKNCQFVGRSEKG